ncbi:MAG: hypothetical protein FWE97_00410 [Dehalococcoidia bacterium]|nr:hypothetical protein [Dehalococcoidia bacterium]
MEVTMKPGRHVIRGLSTVDLSDAIDRAQENNERIALLLWDFLSAIGLDKSSESDSSPFSSHEEMYRRIAIAQDYIFKTREELELAEEELEKLYERG